MVSAAVATASAAVATTSVPATVTATISLPSVMKVASAEWRANRHCKSEMGVMVTKIIQNTGFWLNGRDVYSILEPLIIILRLVGGDGATSPFLYEAMQRARNTIIDRCNRDSSKYKTILQLFDCRKKENISNHVHVAVAFLNHLLMCEGNFSYYNDDVGEAMVHIVRTMVFPHDKKQFVTKLKKYYEKGEKLFNNLSKEVIDSHPCSSWDMHGSSIPLLQKVVVRILSQPCNSL